jgi:hypothetical protein
MWSVTSADTKRRAMAGIAVLAVIVGVVIAVSGGGSSHGHAHRTASGRASNGRSEGTAGSPEGEATGGASGGADGSTAPPRTVVASSYLGVDSKKLRAGLKRGLSLGQIADATPGKSAAGLIDSIVAARATQMKKQKLSPATEKLRLARYRERIAYQVDRVRGSLSLERDLAAAAQYLGMSNRDLHIQVQQGHTLAQISEARTGKSTAGLTEAITKERETHLHTLLTERLLTADAEKKSIADLPKQIAAEIGHKQLQVPSKKS